MLLALILACSISQDAFPDAFGSAACTRLERCDKGAYQDTWTDRADCVDAWASIAQINLDAGDLLGATYDPTAGHQCVHDVRSADCGTLESGQIDCNVWQ